VAKRVLAADVSARLDSAYELILGRYPEPDEQSAVMKFVDAGDDPVKTWTRVCQTLICSGEFRTLY
jgi:hypothetical protein